jgi:hypothetical protein
VERTAFNVSRIQILQFALYANRVITYTVENAILGPASFVAQVLKDRLSLDVYRAH